MLWYGMEDRIHFDAGMESYTQPPAFQLQNEEGKSQRQRQLIA